MPSKRKPKATADILRPGEMLIDDFTPNELVFAPVVANNQKAHGLVPRKHSIYPAEMFAPPTDMGIIARAEWSQRIRDKVAAQSQISDRLLAAGVECLDQNGHGYCWAYSTGGCVMAVRCLNNQPYRRLNPHSVAAVIKNGRDEGGWCGLSAKFLREYGICDETVWPRHSRSLSNWNEAAKTNAKKNLVTEDFVDLTRNIYDQNLTFDQMASCLLANIPCALDFNWWSHSVMGCDLAETSAADFRNAAGKLAMRYDVREFDRIHAVTGYGDSLFGPRIRNSWTEQWGDRGFGILRGSRGVPDGALAIRVVSASVSAASRERVHATAA